MRRRPKKPSSKLLLTPHELLVGFSPASLLEWFVAGVFACSGLGESSDLLVEANSGGFSPLRVGNEGK